MKHTCSLLDKLIVLCTLNREAKIFLRMLSNYRLPPDIETIPFEINLRKKKWLFVSVHKPPSLNNRCFCGSLSKVLYFYSSIYDNKIFFDDLNL